MRFGNLLVKGLIVGLFASLVLTLGGWWPLSKDSLAPVGPGPNGVGPGVAVNPAKGGGRRLRLPAVLIVALVSASCVGCPL